MLRPEGLKLKPIQELHFFKNLLIADLDVKMLIFLAARAEITS
jgi:hypothetical protein